MRKNSRAGLLRLISIVVLLSIFLVGCGSVQNGDIDDSDDSTPPVTEGPSEDGEGTNENTPPTEQDPPMSDPDDIVTPAKKKVALTLDDGPHNVYTKQIVDELAKYGAHATFFVVGNRVDGTEYNGKAGLEYAIANGHEIGIHGYTHTKYYDSCSDAEFTYELASTLSAIKAISPSTEVNLMRPIGGAINSERVNNCSYAVILWDVDSEDWRHTYSKSDSDAERQAKAELIADNILSTVREKSIILMHDIYESTYDALVIVLERLYAEGYEVVTVSELLGSELRSGEKYYSGR